MYLFTLNTTVPEPEVTVTTPNNQTVGQSLTLECSVTAMRGITSRVDIIWSRNSNEVERMEGVSVSSTVGNMAIYKDTYTISQLSTTDRGIEYECTVMINANSVVRATDSVALDVTGEYSTYTGVKETTKKSLPTMHTEHVYQSLRPTGLFLRAQFATLSY